MASCFQHPCHDCQLRLMGMSETNGMASSCRVCCIPFESGRPIYGCCRCGYFIHRLCAMLLPTLQGQDAHPRHPLRLFQAPARSTDAFQCHICGNNGIGFSYRCQSCNFCAHPLCFQLPRMTRSPGHQHPLRLSYQPRSKRSTYCDVCHLRIHQVCYRCPRKTCIFDLHPQCTSKQLANSERKKGYKRAKAKMVGKKVARRTMKILTKGVHVVSAVADLDVGAFIEEHFNDDDDDGEEVHDGTDIDGDDPDGPDDFSIDMGNFYDIMASDGTLDIALQEEATILLLSHMEKMGACDPSSSS